MDLQITYQRDADGRKISSTLPERNKEWVLAFIAENSVKPIGEIEAIVNEGYAEVTSALEGLSDEQASWQPAEHEWSILDVVSHLVTASRSMSALARTLAAGALPPGSEKWQEMSAQDGLSNVTLGSVAEALQAVEQAHQGWLEVIRGLDSADLDTKFSHYIFGPFNAREWSVFERVHHGDHTPQIQRLRDAS